MSLSDETFLDLELIKLVDRYQEAYQTIKILFEDTVSVVSRLMRLAKSIVVEGKVKKRLVELAFNRMAETTAREDERFNDLDARWLSHTIETLFLLDETLHPKHPVKRWCLCC